MSYLDAPRIHFFGKYFANPSTINNNLSNYALKPPLILSWNPDGSAFFRFVDCHVSRAVGSDGNVPAAGAGDPIVQATVTTPQAPPTKVGKIVDLDPDQQSITQLFGVVVTLALPGGQAQSPARWPWPSCVTFGSSESRSVRCRRRCKRNLAVRPDRPPVVRSGPFGVPKESLQYQSRAALNQIQLRRVQRQLQKLDVQPRATRGYDRSVPRE